VGGIARDAFASECLFCNAIHGAQTSGVCEHAHVLHAFLEFLRVETIFEVLKGTVEFLLFQGITEWGWGGSWCIAIANLFVAALEANLAFPAILIMLPPNLTPAVTTTVLKGLAIAFMWWHAPAEDGTDLNGCTQRRRKEDLRCRHAHR
jgi:hypothetical protein